MTNWPPSSSPSQLMSISSYNLDGPVIRRVWITVPNHGREGAPETFTFLGFRHIARMTR